MVFILRLSGITFRVDQNRIVCIDLLAVVIPASVNHIDIFRLKADRDGDLIA